MPDYSLVPVDHQPDFNDHSLVPVDYDPFATDDIIQRTRTQLASQPQTNAGFDQPPSAPQTPGQVLHSQYQAARPTLGVPTTESARSSHYDPPRNRFRPE